MACPWDKIRAISSAKEQFVKTYASVMGIVATIALGGCATKEYVHEYVDGQIAPVNSQVKSLDGRVTGTEAGIRDASGNLSSLNGRIGGIEGTLRDHDGRIVQASKTAQEALDRAIASGRLAEGKFVYEATLSDATTLGFKLENDELSKETKAALDAFAAKLKSENKNVFVEIQGHTDTTGNSAYNLKLGEERAEAVRRYLNMKGGIALHRMSTISYGETAPVADNKTRAGREQNRRVVLVVLK
jgi:outer membrane protein OmpA-like peptidoglycan-associated protein